MDRVSPGAGPTKGAPQGGGIIKDVHRCLDSNDNERIINLINERGEPISAVQAGRMGITSHESTLAALENRANRFTRRGKLRGVDDNLVTWALDETGTIDTSLLCNNYENKERLALAEQ